MTELNELVRVWNHADEEFLARLKRHGAPKRNSYERRIRNNLKAVQAYYRDMPVVKILDPDHILRHNGPYKITADRWSP